MLRRALVLAGMETSAVLIGSSGEGEEELLHLGHVNTVEFAAFFRQAAVQAGATRQEVAEALGVTFLMKGGPAGAQSPRVARSQDSMPAMCTVAQDLARSASPAPIAW